MNNSFAALVFVDGAEKTLSIEEDVGVVSHINADYQEPRNTIGEVQRYKRAHSPVSYKNLRNGYKLTLKENMDSESENSEVSSTSSSSFLYFHSTAESSGGRARQTADAKN